MNFQKSLIIIFTVVFSLASQAVLASSLHQAKAQGWIGEQTNGYIGFVKPGASDEIKELVSDVNSKRRAIYAKNATKHKISLGQVEEVAGERNVKKTASGQYVQDDSGNWVTKK